jgi:hypothetical protein
MVAYTANKKEEVKKYIDKIMIQDPNNTTALDLKKWYDSLK